MSKKRIYIYSVLASVAIAVLMFSDVTKTNKEFSEIVKLSLRDVGHKLLLQNQDSISLVLPVILMEELKYKLSFQKQLSITPDRLVRVVENSFGKVGLPKQYRIEVLQCMHEQVVYSYEIKETLNESIIPCSGRLLPLECYTIDVRFFTKKTAVLNKTSLLYVFLFCVVLIIVLELRFYTKAKQTIAEDANESYIAIGHFQFYPDQNKLIKEAIEIGLSKKECELLALFVAAPNQVIKRDELTKKVWEDNGVFVGRSLDTYISKLRKKLITDTSLKISNIHGVGYKLVVKNNIP